VSESAAIPLFQAYLEALSDIIIGASEKLELAEGARQEFVSDLMFDIAMFHDQGEISLGRSQYEAFIGFMSGEENVSDPEFVGLHELSGNAVKKSFELNELKKSPSFWRKK